MFRSLPPYAQMTHNPFWSAPTPSQWSVQPGLAVLQENRHKNDGLVESQVLSLSYGHVVVKPIEKQRGLVPDSYEGYQILDPGDIVVRPTDLQNDQTSIRVGHVKDRGIITSAYIGLRPAGAWSDSYAYQYLSVVDSSKRIYGMGSGLRQQLRWSDLKRMPCLVPSAEEQAAIVKYLAHANARIDKAIAAKRRLVALLREEATAASRVIFAELNAPILRAKDACLRIIDCKNRTPDYVEGGGFHVIRTTCVRAGKFSMEGSYPTDAENFATWTQRGVPEFGDVFFTREAPAGEAALVPAGIDVCLGQRMMLYRPDPLKIRSEYLMHAIYDEPARRFISLATNGSTVGHLRVGDIGAIPVRVPELSVQDEVLKKIRHIVSTTAQAVNRIEREIALLQEFRTRLVADVVTGQVDVRAIAATLPDAPESFDNTVSATDDDLEEALNEGEE
ncbi:MAG TPA: hypothetical protein DCL70_06435 [Kocuria sp.]|nr:hypothetical protein [Kocuria sp.]